MWGQGVGGMAKGILIPDRPCDLQLMRSNRRPFGTRSRITPLPFTLSSINLQEDLPHLTDPVSYVLWKAFRLILSLANQSRAAP